MQEWKDSSKKAGTGLDAIAISGEVVYEKQRDKQRRKAKIPASLSAT